MDEEMRHPGVWAAATPDRPAITYAPDGGVMTFGAFEALSNRAAHVLRGAGLARGDVAAIFLENRPEYLPLYWGMLRAGLRAVPIATHLTAAEAGTILADSGARVLFTSAKLAPRAREALAGTDAKAFMLDGAAPGLASLEAALTAAPDDPIADQAEGVDMLYSSGTTGRPKGIVKPLPEVPFGVPSPGLKHWAELYGIDERTTYFHPAPLYHAAPLICSMRVLRCGGSLVLTDRFDAERALDIIEGHRVTHSQWVPTHFVRLLRLPDERRARADVSSMRVAIHAAAPCPVEVKRAMIDWWGPIIHEYYAGSEGNGYATLDSREWLRKPGSVGREEIGRVRICDEAGNEVPQGETGTVYFEGGAPFSYHNDPGKTAAARNLHGWTTLGDVGWLDADGYLFLTDRRAFTIVSGGVNIYPAEVEAALIAHPKVDDVAVFGVPNAEFGEEVKAVVQPRAPFAGEPGLADELLAWCRERLSRVKCPRSVDLMAQLPREENGKLYKKGLRDAYWQEASGARAAR